MWTRAPSQGVGTVEKTSSPAVGILTVFPDSHTSSCVTWFGLVPRQGEGKGGGDGATYPPLPPPPSPRVCNGVFLMVRN